MANNYWPSMTDYQEALQSPALAFPDTQLRNLAVVENKLGLPRPICGTFASVYELVQGRQRWAIKCFLRNTPDLHERYAEIAAHLRRHRRLRYFVAFEYQEQAIRVRGQLFPLVKMEWIDACQLNTYIERHLHSPRVLAKLSRRWGELMADLAKADIAHGDLQHGNVLVLANGELRLIDYDGMWVPALKGQGSNETGHPNFQNPSRSQRDFDCHTDRFSAAVIQTAIDAVRLDSALWDRYNNGDNLLFRRSDFLDPQQSALMGELRALGDAHIAERLEFIASRCQRHKPSLAKGRKDRTRKPVDARADSWLSDHVEDFGTQADAQTPPQRNSSEQREESSRPVSLLKAVSWFFRH